MPPRDFRAKYATKVPDESEIVYWMYWDTQLYTSAATVRLNFFGAVPANILAGNIPLAGQMPADQDFLVISPQFIPNADPTVFTSEALNADSSTLGDAVNDVEQLVHNGVMSLIIQNKTYGEWPLHKTPAGGGVWGHTSLAGAGSVATVGALSIANNGFPTAQNALILDPPVTIHQQTNFSIRIDWPTAVTLRGGNVNCRVLLEGQLIRPKQ